MNDELKRLSAAATDFIHSDCLCQACALDKAMRSGINRLLADIDALMAVAKAAEGNLDSSPTGQHLPIIDALDALPPHIKRELGMSE